MTDSFYSRIERFGEVSSTQPIVRGWLAQGTPEVAIATADVQTAGRGRHDRDWQAPSGAALLLSAGFRPSGRAVQPRHGWRVAATVALAMLDAAEAAAGLADDTLWLKWPNDIVAEASDGFPRKVAGVLAEASAVGEELQQVVVGIGINADWAPADFPPELRQTMTSLHALAGGRPVDREQLLEEFLARLEPRYLALREGHFDAGGWSRRQLTTGRDVELAIGEERPIVGRAVGVDPQSGALLLETGATRLSLDSGEVVRCRIVDLPRLM